MNLSKGDYMPSEPSPIFSTDREVKNFKIKEKRYTAKHKTSKGLFLDVTPKGVKSWWYRYTLNAKQERLVIGHYPDIPLDEAVKKRNEAANKVANGISPQKQKQNEKKGLSDAITLQAYGERYYNEVIMKERANPVQMRRYLINDIYPIIGHIAMKDITTNDIRTAIWRKKEQGYDATAQQVRGLLKRIFDYAVTLGIIPYNPVLAIPTRHVFKEKPRDRFLTIAEIRIYYTTLLSSRVHKAKKLGIILSLLTMVRKTELITAKWENIDFENRMWLFPKTKANSKTGNSREMIVYLSSQMIEILKDLKAMAGNEPYVFAGRKTGTHIAHNTLNNAQKAALALTDVAHFTIHDLRRTASTHLNEKGFNRDAIEKCLNHTLGGVRGIYNKAEYADERIKMMQAWSDFVFSVIYQKNLIFFNEVAQRRAG